MPRYPMPTPFRTFLAVLLAATAAGAATVATAPDSETAAPAKTPAATTPAADGVTLRGEVVDLHCYLARGAKGPDHAGCANACLRRGVTPGFLAEDGRLFVVLEEKPISPKERVDGLAGKTVTVKGAIVERDGVRGLQMKSVEAKMTSE